MLSSRAGPGRRNRRSRSCRAEGPQTSLSSQAERAVTSVLDPPAPTDSSEAPRSEFVFCLPAFGDLGASCAAPAGHAPCEVGLSFSVFSEAFRLAPSCQLDALNPKVIPLPRKVVQELLLAAALAPLVCSDIAAPLSDTVYATDASKQKGAICSAEQLPQHLREVLGRPLTVRARRQNCVMRSAQVVLKRADPFWGEEAFGAPKRQQAARLLLRCACSRRRCWGARAWCLRSDVAAVLAALPGVSRVAAACSFGSTLHEQSQLPGVI